MFSLNDIITSAFPCCERFNDKTIFTCVIFLRVTCTWHCSLFTVSGKLSRQVCCVYDYVTCERSVDYTCLSVVCAIVNTVTCERYYHTVSMSQLAVFVLLWGRSACMIIISLTGTNIIIFFE